MIESVVGIAGAVVLLLGLTLASIGLYGMFRKPSIFEQLHAAGLVTGPGVILVLVASMASARFEIATSALLIVAFVLVTASLSTHAIALAASRERDRVGARRGRPPSGGRDAAGGEAGRPVATMRVLLAHDGSPGAEVATALTAAVPWPEGSAIRVISVTDGELELFSEPRDAPEASDGAAGLRDSLAEVATRLARSGVTVDQVLRRGDAASAIAEEAGAFAADLVVIGSRGLGPVRSLLVGSVAAATIDAAPCSVLVARTPRLASVVLGADGSAEMDLATDAVARWPMFADAAIAVLSVATGAPGYGGRTGVGAFTATAARAEQQKLADGVASRLIADGRRASAHVRDGDAAAQIVGLAASRSADLIVLGTRKRTGIRRALLGSVGRAVVGSTEASVLIVKGAP